jgi:transcriptional regulator with XRE-family HTH domain
MLAGVSATYYARLERGIDHHPSAQVVDALAAALGLDESAHDHLRRLAEPPPPRPRKPRRREKLAPGLEVVLSNWTTQPAFVVGRYSDVLAANPLATLLNPGYAAGANVVRQIFLDPASRQTYLDWEPFAQNSAAVLRASIGADIDDSRLTELVGELSVASEDFRRMWARHDVRELAQGSVRYYNPLVGPITLDYVTLTINGTEHQTLYVHYAKPGSDHERALNLLATISQADTPTTSEDS